MLAEEGVRLNGPEGGDWALEAEEVEKRREKVREDRR